MRSHGQRAFAARGVSGAGARERPVAPIANGQNGLVGRHVVRLPARERGEHGPYRKSRLMARSGRKNRGKRKLQRRLYNRPAYVLDYHQLSFPRLHVQLEATGYNPHRGPSIRRAFWSIVPPGRYSSGRGRELILVYRRKIEDELARLIAKRSLGYWLHVYRRLPSIPGGPGADSASEVLTRQTLEAAFRKYAMIEPCSGIADSADTPSSAVLDGGVGEAEKHFIQSGMSASRQYVLTGFGVDELREVYDAESLSFEIWRCGAALRMLAKGATLLARRDGLGFSDVRTEELNRLVASLDARARVPLTASASAVVFGGASSSRREGVLLAPSYNDQLRGIGEFTHGLDRVVGYRIPEETTKFIWSGLQIGAYLQHHAAFSDAFKERYGVRLEAVLVTIAALLFWAFVLWCDREKGPIALFQHWHYAYHGPVSRDALLRKLQEALPHTLHRFFPNIRVTADELPGAIAFLDLDDGKRQGIDIMLGGPRSIFVPFGADRVFVDYAWIPNLLYELMYGLTIPDQNFKGSLLEHVVRNGRSVLPEGELKALDGSRRQIDAAIRAGRNLVVVECKAVSRSLGVDKGDPRAQEYRVSLIERALREADEKARWLATHRSGSNYDVSAYDRIIPVVATPFVEFIPSLAPHYWLTPTLPRVLTPDELSQAADQGTLSSDRLYNATALV